ncbi:MAG: DUF86 domain-containing protein [bacterium]
MDILKSKIKLIVENLPKLKDTLPSSFDEFQTKDVFRSASERYFQLIVDAIIDCNQILIEINNLEVSDTYFDTFGNLVGKSIFPNDLLENMSHCVGTRNAIIHRYENIQLKREYEDIEKYLPMFSQYLKIISEKYL